MGISMDDRRGARDGTETAVISKTVLLSAVFTCLWPFCIRAQEKVVEKYPDGSIRARYSVNEGGKKHGVYQEYHPGGKTRILARYENGKLHGNYEKRFPDGKVHISTSYQSGILHGKFVERFSNGRIRVKAAYRDGKHHGPYRQWTDQGDLYKSGTYREGAWHGKVTVFKEKEVIWQQVWKNGRIAALQGVVVYPRTRESIRGQLQALGAWKPRPPGPVSKKDDRRRALDHLKIYRYLADVPYSDLVLDERMNQFCEAAAEICHRIGRITHEPPNPGLPRARYRVALIGALNSNLHSGSSMAASVEGFMDDSDASNIECLGHRRWCLNPRMKRVGFGASGSASAMWAMNRSRKKVPDQAFVAFPPRGFMPIGYIRPHYAWSVSINPRRFRIVGKEGVEVKVHALDREYMKVGKSVELENKNVNEEGCGEGTCIIFRPQACSFKDGSRYWVEIGGLTTSRGKLTAPSIQYLVEFIQLKERK